MSAGDIDDTVGDINELDRLQSENPELSAFISRGREIPINKEYDVPFGAGIARDGSRVYIDRHLHTRFRGLDISHVLATHEVVEWALRKYANIGVDYARDPRGHRLANAAERRELFTMFQSDQIWPAYNDFIDPQVKRDETESIKKSPPDLDLYPYAGTAMEKTLERTGTRAGSDRELGAGQESGSPRPVDDRPRADSGGKVSKASVHYRAGTLHQRCGECSMFQAPKSCTHVAGQISPAGYCDDFEEKK